jgi:hypothetical protein
VYHSSKKNKKNTIKSRKRKKRNKKVVIGERKRVSEIPRYQNLRRWTIISHKANTASKFNEKIQDKTDCDRATHYCAGWHENTIKYSQAWKRQLDGLT